MSTLQQFNQIQPVESQIDFFKSLNLQEKLQLFLALGKQEQVNLFDNLSTTDDQPTSHQIDLINVLPEQVKIDILKEFYGFNIASFRQSSIQNKANIIINNSNPIIIIGIFTLLLPPEKIPVLNLLPPQKKIDLINNLLSPEEKNIVFLSLYNPDDKITVFNAINLKSRVGIFENLPLQLAIEIFNRISSSDKIFLFNQMLKNMKYEIVVSILNVTDFFPVPESIKLAETTKAPGNVMKLLTQKKIAYSPGEYKLGDIRRNPRIIASTDIIGLKDFFCDLEVFNWRILPSTSEFLYGLNHISIFKVYTLYLIKMLNLENRVKAYLDTYSKNYSGNKDTAVVADEKRPDVFYNFGFGYRSTPIRIDLTNDVNEIFRYSLQYPLTERYIKNTDLIQFLKNDDGYNSIISPIHIHQKINNQYTFFVEPEISSRDSKDFNIFFVNVTNNHYSFIFLDKRADRAKYRNDNIAIEYYDPHGANINPELITFLNRNLPILFPDYSNNIISDYTGNDKLLGIQVIGENNETENGFCVIWSHMMMHLKLLNTNIRIKNIEKFFISYCKRKGYSIYEVMVNYAEYMKRVLLLNDPNDPRTRTAKFYRLSKLFGGIFERTEEIIAPENIIDYEDL